LTAGINGYRLDFKASKIFSKLPQKMQRRFQKRLKHCPKSLPMEFASSEKNSKDFTKTQFIPKRLQIKN